MPLAELHTSISTYIHYRVTAVKDSMGNQHRVHDFKVKVFTKKNLGLKETGRSKSCSQGISNDNRLKHMEGRYNQ